LNWEEDGPDSKTIHVRHITTRCHTGTGCCDSHPGTGCPCKKCHEHCMVLDLDAAGYGQCDGPSLANTLVSEHGAQCPDGDDAGGAYPPALRDYSGAFPRRTSRFSIYAQDGSVFNDVERPSGAPSASAPRHKSTVPSDESSTSSTWSQRTITQDDYIQRPIHSQGSSKVRRRKAREARNDAVCSPANTSSSFDHPHDQGHGLLPYAYGPPPTVPSDYFPVAPRSATSQDNFSYISDATMSTAQDFTSAAASNFNGFIPVPQQVHCACCRLLGHDATLISESP
jgi:hypothetical protein